jgi:hypothetical protein
MRDFKQNGCLNVPRQGSRRSCLGKIKLETNSCRTCSVVREVVRLGKVQG